MFDYPSQYSKNKEGIIMSAESPLSVDQTAANISDSLSRNVQAEAIVDIADQINKDTQALESAVEKGEGKDEINKKLDDQKKNLNDAKNQMSNVPYMPGGQDTGVEKMIEILLNALRKMIATLFGLKAQGLGDGDRIEANIRQGEAVENRATEIAAQGKSATGPKRDANSPEYS